MKKKSITTLTTITFSLVANLASAATLTFGEGQDIFANGYTEAGMIISTPSTSYPHIRNWQIDPSFGERELLDSDGAPFVFHLSSGNTFDLISLDVENPHGTGPLWSSNGSIDVIGSNGPVVNLLAHEFGTHSFGTTFIGINSFTIQYAEGAQLTFDNVKFQTTAVPLPSAFWLFLSLLPAIVITRRSGRSGSTSLPRSA
jgi:hypothetical protein